MTKIEKIRALQVMGYSPEMIAAEVGCGIAYVLSHLHTPKDYSERNMVRKMYSGGKSTIEINRATGLKFCIIANHLRTPRVTGASF